MPMGKRSCAFRTRSASGVTDETIARLAELRRKRTASTLYPGNLPAPAYKERVAAIDKEIARLEALDG